MACSSTPQLAGGGVFSSSSSISPTRQLLLQAHGRPPRTLSLCSAVRARFTVKAGIATSEECNEEDCAPEKEVGKVSMEWKAAESTQVLGTYPPLNKKKWTGYVEKDTAGQTNIYAVEPTVYVSENVISSNTAGDSSKGSEQTVLVTVGLALGLLFGAGAVLQWLSSFASYSQQQQQQVSSFAGPTLTYYIQRFTPSPPPPELPVEESVVREAPGLLDAAVPAISQGQAVVSPSGDSTISVEISVTSE